VDLNPQIAQRAYEIYQDRVRAKARQSETGSKAEREIRKGLPGQPKPRRTSA